MIALLPGESRALFPRLMDEMYDLRLGAARAHAGRPSARSIGWRSSIILIRWIRSTFLRSTKWNASRER